MSHPQQKERIRPGVRHSFSGAALIIAAGLMAGAWPVAVRADEPTAMDEVVVTGERTGPGMWHVHHGSAQLWILGSLSPLPKGITWKADEVERVLDGTNRVLVPKP